MTRKVKNPLPQLARTGDGRSARWDAHREERQSELVAATVRAIDLHGPEVGMAEIAREAGVSKPVLYRYFADKAELHAAVGRWGAHEVVDAIVPVLLAGPPTHERVEEAVDAYLATIAQHPQVFLLLVRQRVEGSDPLADGKAAVAAMFARVLGDTLRTLGVDAAGAEPWAHGLVGLGLATGEWWLERETMSRTAVSRYLTEFVWHAFEGIAAEYGVPLGATEIQVVDPTTATKGTAR
ncbi:TetR/AcrR family transcriptional regulator [Nocardioides pacificus]